ncbi:hypothetical protein NQ095_17400 [Rossellomorea sp. SC111]|uniref:hypothetical protein n=1 Tax=Rossellomorea sp. SC111 TaxID=2968985 RepID=UPI00215AC05B|nr:hypothetical protein [Rossellomorea sp. SC111]MCR8850199.1 hypothetical protein [Rossellomorea sp. SC111]
MTELADAGMIIVVIAGTTDSVVTGINSFLATGEDVTCLGRMTNAEDADAEETMSGEQKTGTEAAEEEEAMKTTIETADAKKDTETASAIYSGKRIELRFKRGSFFGEKKTL